MAEKEERILIKKQINYHPPYGGWCGDGKEIVLKRQEAIERMAKALIRADYPNAQESIWAMRWKNPASKDYYLIMANAALNALLEGK